jgi:hypothetical protein
MENTMSETMPEITQPTDKRKIRRALWRWNEDGTYNRKPKDPNYFNNYWHEKRKFIANLKIECEYCQKLTMKRNYLRHQQNKKCIEAKNKQMENLVQ